MLSLSMASPGTAATFLKASPLSISTSSSFRALRIQHQVSARVSTMVSSSSRKPLVVTMSKREAELKDIRATEQIQEEVVDLKGELFMPPLQKSARNEFESSEFRQMKKMNRFLRVQNVQIFTMETGNLYVKF